MIEKDLEIVNRLGLHARAAAKLVQTASKFAAVIELSKDDKTTNAQSIMGVMMLAAAQGSVVRLTIQGTDEEEAALAIETLIAQRFGEPQ